MQKRSTLNAQPHFLLVKNTLFVICLPFRNFLAKKYAKMRFYRIKKNILPKRDFIGFFPTTLRCVGTRFECIPSSSFSSSSSSSRLLRARAVHRPPGPLECLIFLRNFEVFPLHTEVYPRLNFCALALCIGPQDLWNPSFSSGISRFFLPILRSTLGSISARSRCASAPRTSGIPHFP